MGQIKLLTAPIRSIVSFPLFQLAVVVTLILFLKAGDDNSLRGQMFNGFDKAVESYRGIDFSDVQREIFHQIMAHNRFLDSYVYLACLAILASLFG